MFEGGNAEHTGKRQVRLVHVYIANGTGGRAKGSKEPGHKQTPTAAATLIKQKPATQLQTPECEVLAFFVKWGGVRLQGYV